MLFILAIYLVIGLCVAVITIRAFPPVQDYRPPGWLRVVAALTYVLLWPFTALILLWDRWLPAEVDGDTPPPASKPIHGFGARLRIDPRQLFWRTRHRAFEPSEHERIDREG